MRCVAGVHGMAPPARVAAECLPPHACACTRPPRRAGGVRLQRRVARQAGSHEARLLRQQLLLGCARLLSRSAAHDLLCAAAAALCCAPCPRSPWRQRRRPRTAIPLTSLPPDPAPDRAQDAGIISDKAALEWKTSPGVRAAACYLGAPRVVKAPPLPAAALTPCLRPAHASHPLARARRSSRGARPRSAARTRPRWPRPTACPRRRRPTFAWTSPSATRCSRRASTSGRATRSRS